MKQPTARVIALCLGLALAMVGRCNAEVVDTEKLLRPIDPHAFQDFGYAVAISGTNAVVGAPESALQPGAAYVYSKFGTNWIFQQKLVPVQATTNDLVGAAVAIEGNLLALGAPGFNTNPSSANFGSVYIYELTNGVWGQQATLTAPDRQRADKFGDSVALSGLSVVVGAPFHSDLGSTNNGSIYVYDLTGAGWQLSAKIVPNDLTNNSTFGQRVAMSDNTLIAGANSSLVSIGNFLFTAPGAAYVYTRTNVTPFFAPWNLQQKLLPNNFNDGGQFGYSLALDGDTALVGAPFTSEGGTVYAFVRTRNFWTNQTQLVPADRTNGDNFGFTVALQGTRAVIGAVSKNSNNITGLGAAYVFTQTNVFVATNGLGETNVGWIEQQELFPLQASDDFEFGFSVGIGAQGIIVGGPAAPIGRGTGAAYMFGSSEALLSIVAAVASPTILTPPNHLMVPVTINVVTTGSNVTCAIVSVTSNQADVGVGMNSDAPDSVITGPLTLLLRAELPDNVNVDRIYNVLIECVDEFGNIATTTVPVIVPHTLGAATTTSAFSTGPVLNNGFINFGTINNGVVVPGVMNTEVGVTTTTPFTRNLAAP